MPRKAVKTDQAKVYAEVTLRTETGASILRDAPRLGFNDLKMFQATEENPDDLKRILRKVGFNVVAATRFGLSIVGPAELYKDYFKTNIVERPTKMFFGGNQEYEGDSFFMEEVPAISKDISNLAETVYLPRRGYFLAGEGPMPATSYYALRPPADITRLTNADAAHTQGYRGNGVKVAMVDSGFIRNHDYYSSRGYNLTVHAAVGSTTQDEYGHGTGIASNLLAIAPDCDFHFYKMSDGTQWASLAAFRMAVQDGMQVITNSWGQMRDPVLEAEIIDAVNNRGITVIFACGNGGPVGWPGCMPDVISVGGAYPTQDNTWVASNYASSGVNAHFPERHCPDFCGIVGMSPKGIFIVQPTMKNAIFDNSFSNSVFPNGDETAGNDGWLVASGTSSAAPMVAGAAALMLEAKSNLSPVEIKQNLADTCIDVLNGSSASGELAGIGPDSATGRGRIDIGAAVARVRPTIVCRTAPVVCVRAPAVACPPGPMVCLRAPIIDCAIAPIQCAVAPVQCTRAPVQCARAPFICRLAPVIECLRAPIDIRCPPGPLDGCFAGPWKRPIDPRERVRIPERVREMPRRVPRNLVPVVVMVNEEELDMWLAEESAYAQMGMSEEYSDFPDGEGGEGGQFNPSAA